MPMTTQTPSATALAKPTRAQHDDLVSAAASAPVLSVRGLSIDFHLRTHVLHAVRDVSFDLFSGQTLCLVGESGSGKSVTARALLRLIDPQAKVSGGSITLQGPDGELRLDTLAPNGREIRAVRGGRIGLIFQEPMSSLSPVHTIGSQIVEALLLHRKMTKAEAKAETVKLLRQVEIANPEQMADRYTFEFSGGMRQRAMIAMALACKPDILIADEPTTALDVTTQAEIMDLIARLQRETGMAMLMITHDLGLVAEVADSVAVMRWGRVVEQGPVDAIFHAPHHPYTRKLLSATLRLDTAAKRTAPATTGQPLLSVRGLCKGFGTTNWRGQQTFAIKAVDDVSLDLWPGENLGIVGESGSGKTTLGRMLLRIIEPSNGSILWQGNGQAAEVTKMQRPELAQYRSAVRLVFQDPFASLNPRMTVKQVIADPLIVAGALNGAALEARVGDLLELVGLERSAMERYPHAFSGGQRQRIGIARALALDPRVIIADEATSALDVSIRAQVLDLLLDLQKRLDLSFVFIAHDISVVRYFCDRVVVMHKGRIVETGPAEQICTRPAEPYTQSLISAVPNPDPRNRRMLHRTRFGA